jgi:negative regulator of flagellin synthesis FlgM
MNINGPSNKTSPLINEQTRSTLVDPQQRQNQNAPGNAGEQSSDDALTLTNMVSHLQKVEQKLAGQPVVDQDKVNSIRQQLKDGTYKVDADRVADKMMQIETLLLDKLG